MNEVPDECDLSSGTSEDCNGNNIPDECDIADSTSEDCNSNGIPDDCDIQSGASDDCNVNSVPDECDIANGTSQDCNSNGVPDECDLSSGASQDCNANNIPDECDIASGTSQDCNSDGLPDECGLVSVAVAGSDECSSAPLVLPGLIYNGDTTTATQDGSESCTGYDSPDVWYRYIPAVSGTLTISLCGSSYDTALSVHTGCPGDTTNEIACNDDSCDLSSEVTLSVTAGEEYLIRIGGYDSDVGTYRMQLFGPPALGLVPDCNANGTPDECDITSGTSQDCNANGIPDECEPDCNGNGIADECDISSGSSEDCNENGVPDECDLQSGASEDCNANGIPDECDIADGVSDDCDENGVPDECEPDCNGNGQSDLCDIWMGFSEDCNWNAVPDECEPDCNGNGVADNCDILFATSADCNTNGVPDECDIQSGNSTDCNANGIPDECELYVAYGPSSPALAPWYYGSPQSYTFTSVPDALSSVTIVLVSNSDLGDAYYEYAGVYLGSTYLGDVRFANGGNDCVDAIGVLYLSAAQFNSLVAAGGGDAAFDLIATPDVEGFCPDPYIAISLNYLTTETLSDCNSNGVLDECETDCNGNGVPDDCDLSSGTSEDCNSNGVPDECDIQSGTSEDCNTNNIPDECDLANGTSQDCNLNSVPDECDIASGASGDLNGNGVPDECDPDCNSNGVPDDLDIGAPFEADSGLLAPWYAGSPQSYLIVSPPPAATAVQISLTALSDLGDIDFEYATVDVNGVPVGDAKFVSDGDCTTGTATLTMSAAAFNAAVAGGDALIGLTPSPDVGGFCDDSFISVHVMYVPVGVSLDCNQNGIPDECDIADGTSQDCNANGIPDECEADCNDNGVADDCDLTSGTSQDCNSNAIPDECDIASGFSEDCNSDDIPDECQLVDVVTQIAAAPNLGIVGQPLDLTVTFSNSFGTATQLSAIIVVPGILPVTNVTTTMGSVTDLGGGLYQLDVPSLPGMGAAVVTISTLPSATGAVQVLASASTCIFDFDPENNVDALFVRIGLDCNTNGIEDEDEVSPTEGAVLFHEDFESGLGLWDASGLWHVAPTLDCVTTTGSLTPATAAIYNTGSPDCNYDVGITQGALELTTDVVIPAPWGARLKWFNFVETENSYPYDNWLVQVSSDGGTNWQTVYDGRGASRPGWQELSADLTQFAGQAVRIRFVFDSLDAGFNAFFGWYVDDVRLIALDAPLSPDCNQNHIPDECDITGGTSTDCNANSIPDECELDQVVAFASGVLEPFDGTTSQSFVVSSVPPAIGMVTLHLTAYGDFGDPLLETVDFYLNGTWIATTPIYTGGQDCTYGTAVVHIPQATYNALTSGGFAQFDFVANPNVNACAGSFITAMFDYLVLDPAKDCNSNGILDECETDCNENGVPDDCDLSGGVSQDCNANNVPDECDISQGTSQDCNSNSVPDECDLQSGASQDCNDNNVPDECDIASGASEDCNANGVPDECDLSGGVSQDCNGNGVPDECDISDGTSEDCNSNNIPDECDLQSGASQDCNSNSVPDECDIASGTSEDCNGNGIPDECDVASGASEDCNENGIPDECETDCNSNGVPDDCDIAGGSSEDCNSNNIPDECDIQSGASEDCNGNGIPDECDLANGSSEDCNSNNIPDECDLSGGTSQDCNANNIPDECDIVDGTSEDCNGNGVPDECDIQSGVSEDCNGNGIPDECDLSLGTSQDCNSNNIPDECDVRPEVGALVWSEDFESGLGNWSTSGLWRLEVGHECLSEDGSLTTVTRAAYNDPSQCSYDVGETSGVLELQTDVSVPVGGGVLFWYNWVETEDLPPYDGWRLEVSSDGGSTWQEVFDGKGLSRPYWQELWADVSAYAGQSIRVRFVFDSLDDEFNDYLGWYVDDVRLYELAGAATSSDCNINGIPDECEVDCNGNGVPDDCDLLDGTSEDCNGNAVPDECDIQSGTSEDCNTNGIPDECDLSSGTSQDCNANGIPDECDIASGASEDCNGNNIPDECETDCNVNGVPDDCDIAEGTSEDCNANGVPDECDIQSGTSQDCNSNNVPDECDLSSGSSQDCNDNSVPDECDISSGTSEDCNSNNVPDECDIKSGTSEDCNVNNIPDECDIATGASEDCNANGTPDECETDCNENGVPDDCDIAEGTSGDCNANSIPDECDLANGTSEDCNSNGIPDECDISDGTSEDCNENGVPDECDLTSGLSQDCNENGIPDECETDCNENGVPDDCDIGEGNSRDDNFDGVPDECQSADLAITKLGEINPAQAGYQLVYTLVVHNLGPAAAPNVVVVDPLPAGVTFVSASSTKGTCSYVPHTVTCTVGLLAVDEVATVTITTIPMTPGTYDNTASVASSITDTVTANDSSFVSNDVCDPFTPIIIDTLDPLTGGDSGWRPFAFQIPDFADQIYDTTNTALVARITADPTRFRTAGHVTLQSMWLPYSAVGSEHYVRGKFYVFAKGITDWSTMTEGTDWTTTGAMPNVRLRLSHRFAQNSMLEVFNHRNIDPEASDAVGADIRPSTDPSNPSLYRVDFDPVDTPYLRDSGTTEGIWAAYEAYSVDPQDQGIVGLTEVQLGVYPASLLPDSVAPVKVYAPSSSDAGTLAVVSPTDLQLETRYPISGPGDVPDLDPSAPLPQHFEGPEGITLSTVGIPADRLAIAVREFDAGSDLTQRVRVEANKIYKVRFHVTSTKPTNVQPQFRGRTRTARFLWSQKMEVGGAWNAGPESNADAQQALPGVGCLNPDRAPGDTTGGWYTLLFHSPLNPDIRPEFAPGTPVETRMPGLAAQPGPGVNAASLRDLRVGFDVLDTLSGSALSGLEEGEFTLDRIEIRVYDEPGDSGWCPPIPLGSPSEE
ncbi:MAG: hypothetical protein N2644_05385 [Candidatus Sumerlaea chitinivorans]|nr:hypothetical protein [Candidatus Sumerlaea chitinivorans]